VARKIFISYRRDDVKADARGIYDRLAPKYGANGVFMDVRDLSGGQIFDKVIADALAQSDVLLAIIGPNWMNLLSARMAAGGKDLMREEIATALKRNLFVIPVLIERSPLPAADSLPDDIRALVDREAEDVRFKYFDRDMENIAAAIDKLREHHARKAIKNSEQLWDWLKDRPIEVPRAIAARAALRVLPQACDRAERLVQKRAQVAAPSATSEQSDQSLSQADQEYRRAMQAVEASQQAELERADVSLLKVFRGIATAWFAAVASNHVTEDIKAAAHAAAGGIDTLSDGLSLGMDVARAAHEAPMTAVASITRTRTDTLRLEPAGRHASRAAAPTRADAGTTAFTADLEWFDRNQAGPELTAQPLWPAGAAPEEWAARWQRLRIAMLTLDPTWEVWTKWFEDRISGAPFDVEIERKRVLVPEEIWRQPPAYVNTYIAKQCR
jgi:hypothetical protein